MVGFYEVRCIWNEAMVNRPREVVDCTQGRDEEFDKIRQRREGKSKLRV